MYKRSALVIRPRFAVGIGAGSRAAYVHDFWRGRSGGTTKLVDAYGLLGDDMPIGCAGYRIDRHGAQIFRLYELVQRVWRSMLIVAKVPDRLSHLREILPHRVRTCR